MRIVFVGAGDVSVETAKTLIAQDHEIIMIDINKDRIEQLSDSLACSFIVGDGAHPEILKEVNPEDTDILFCLTDRDQVNILASLVGRSLGFKRIITSIADTEFEPVCDELNLKNIIVPVRTIGRYLSDVVNGNETAELSTVLKDEARFFSFTLKNPEQILVKELGLPTEAKVVCYYRENKFILADEGTKLFAGDEVVILTHSKNLLKLRERWQ
jgi:trk system potassium uptake protein TrkA